MNFPPHDNEDKKSGSGCSGCCCWLVLILIGLIIVGVFFTNFIEYFAFNTTVGDFRVLVVANNVLYCSAPVGACDFIGTAQGLEELRQADVFLQRIR